MPVRRVIALLGLVVSISGRGKRAGHGFGGFSTDLRGILALFADGEQSASLSAALSASCSGVQPLPGKHGPQSCWRSMSWRWARRQGPPGAMASRGVVP